MTIELYIIDYEPLKKYKDRFPEFFELIKLYNTFIDEVIDLIESNHMKMIDAKTKFNKFISFEYDIIFPLFKKSINLPFLLNKIEAFEANNKNTKIDILCEYYFYFKKIKKNILEIYNKKEYTIILYI